METKSMVSSIIALTVAVLLVAVILIPIINDAQTSIASETRENDTYYYTATDIVGDYAYTLTGGTLYVNGEELALTNQHGGYTIQNAITNEVGFLHVNQNESIILGNGDASTTTVTAITYAADGTCTFTSSGGDGTASGVTRGFFPINGGTLGVYVNNNTFNVTNGQAVYFGYNSNTNFTLTIGENAYPMNALFSMVNGEVTTVWAEYNNGTEWVDVTDSTTATYSGSYTENDGYGTYVGTNYRVVSDLGTVPTPNAHLGMFAPISYNVIADSSMANLIGVIPVLVIVGLVIGAVRLVVTRSKD